MLSALSERQGGLRAVTAQPPPPKKVDAHSDLLNQIRSGKALKKAEPVAATKEATQSNSVAAILSRRIAIQGAESDSDSDDDDEDEWD